MKRYVFPNLLLVFMLMAACYTQVTPPRYTATAADESPLPANLIGSWEWVRLVDGTNEIIVETPERYTLTLGGAGHLAVVADCNRGRADFVTVKDDSITVGPIMITKIGCGPASHERRFREALARTAAYEARQDTLILRPEQGGTLYFARAAR